jgi:hypothetical protein
MVFLIVAVITQFTTSGVERFMRALAAASGFLIYMGAKALGLSIPDLLFRLVDPSVRSVCGRATSTTR